MFTEQRLPDPERLRLLDAILERARDRAHPQSPVIVFDLDGTLLDNRPRVVAILKELADEWLRTHPEAAELCARATPDQIVYGFVQNLEGLGISDRTLHEQGLAFWRARFFADPHIRHDVEVAGAIDYVRACYDAGAVIVYLTGRDLPNMALGSFGSLRDLGFPIGVIGTELVVKPTFEMPDEVFKRGVAPAIRRLGRLVAAFDNEPANCNLFLDEYPDCAAVFLDTQYAPDPPRLDPRAHVIHTFERGR